MLAVLYLLLCTVFGFTLIALCVPDVRRLYTAMSPSRKNTSYVPSSLFAVPAGIIAGLISVTFFSYFVTLGLSYVVTDASLCKNLSVLVTFAFFLFLILNNTILLSRKSEKNPGTALLPKFSGHNGSAVFYGLSIAGFTAVATFLMYYTYRIVDGTLYAGYSVFSDLSPHTAMVSSFGVGFNFPTQYMHFSGSGIKYHFFFYYLCGQLEFLGLPIDAAINVPSIITMVCAFTLLGLLATLLSGRRLTFILAPVLVLFRSSFNVFIHIHDLMATGLTLKDSISQIASSPEWYEVTPYDSWGIWAINVYPNQRHLMLGVSVILILIILFLPYMRRMCISMLSAGSFGNALKAFLFSRDAWLPRTADPLNPIKCTALCCLIVVLMPYFHGSALIAALLILFGMAIFSESRLLHLAVAVCAVISSEILTNIFSGGAENVISFTVNTGFVVENKTASAIALYILIVTGFTLILGLLTALIWLIRDIIRKKPVYRSLLFLCFLIPFAFAFVFQLTLEMLANHKFIQISLILIDIFTAAFIANLFYLPFKVREPASKTDTPEEAPVDDTPEASDETGESDSEETGVTAEENTTDKTMVHEPIPEPKPSGMPLGVYSILQVFASALAIVLMVGLTGTGLSEWATYLNLNRDGYYVVNTKSEVTEWIIENTSEDDVFLTPMWSMNRFLLTGRAMYYGWPYYAWSAGYDTYTRDEIYCWLVSGAAGNKDEFVRYCKERHIRYMLDDGEFYYQTYETGTGYDGQFFADNFTAVATFPEEGAVIYQLYD